MEQENLLFEEPPEFKPPKLSTKKSQKSASFESSDVSNPQQVALTTHGCAGKRGKFYVCNTLVNAVLQQHI